MLLGSFTESRADKNMLDRLFYMFFYMRILKVIGGIVGIIQNEKALDKFFLVAPELSYMLHEFATEYGID